MSRKEIYTGRTILDKEANYEDNGDGTPLESLSIDAESIVRDQYYVATWRTNGTQWGDVYAVDGPFQRFEDAEKAAV